MRFNGRIRHNETYETLSHSEFLQLSRPLNPLSTIHSHHNTVNFEAQNAIIGFELEITE